MITKFKAIFYCNKCAEYYVDSISNRECTKCKSTNIKIIEIYEKNTDTDTFNLNKFNCKSE